MNIILVRHAESEANRLGITQGQTIDTSLSKSGLRQAKQLAERLKDEKIDIIYSSDLKRAKETADEINRYHKLKIIFDRRLREMDYGNENLESFITRCKVFMKSFQKEKGNILIVAHGGINITIMAITTGSRKKGGEIARRIRQCNTCVNVVEKEGKHYKIKLTNCVRHLDADKKLIEIFEKVQKIPYRACKFDETKIDSSLKFGDCRHKSALLKKLLNKEGYETKKMKVIFNWKDLPLPKKMFSILNKSSTVWVHDALAVKVHGSYIFLDPAWHLELKSLGFPITEKWNGLEDTKQVTEGKLEFYKQKDFNLKKEKILKKYGVKIDKDEAAKFANALNALLARAKKKR